MDNIFGSDEDFTDGRFVFHPVLYSFIYRQLTKLKVNKATGLDQIPSCMLKLSPYINLGVVKIWKIWIL